MKSNRVKLIDMIRCDKCSFEYDVMDQGGNGTIIAQKHAKKHTVRREIGTKIIYSPAHKGEELEVDFKI